MELDDLKNTWKQSEEIKKPINSNIMELIQNKSYGPVATLKRRFRRQLTLIPILVCIVINSLSRHHYIFQDPLFWCYVFFCCVLVCYFYINYRYISKMQRMDVAIKETFEAQVQSLETRFKWHTILVRTMLLLYIVLVEVLSYLGMEPALEKWHNVDWYLRLGAYIVFIALIYGLNKLVFTRKYGRHLTYLKQLVSELK